jgi:hypothetical protein
MGHLYIAARCRLVLCYATNTDASLPCRGRTARWPVSCDLMITIHSFTEHLSILTRGHAIMRFMTPHEHSRTPLSRSGSAPPRIEPDKTAWPGSKRSETTARAKLQEPKGGGLFGTGASRPVRCTRRCGLSSPATIPYPSSSSPIRSDKR